MCESGGGEGVHVSLPLLSANLLPLLLLLLLSQPGLEKEAGEQTGRCGGNVEGRGGEESAELEHQRVAGTEALGMLPPASGGRGPALTQRAAFGGFGITCPSTHPWTFLLN